VLYTSDYGYSDRLSQTLAKGITKAGVKTEMVDVLSVDPQVGRTGNCCRCVWGGWVGE
jgi:flavorubredoxin